MPDIWHTANKVFAVPVAVVGALPSATVGEVFAVCLRVFAVCLGHTANSVVSGSESNHSQKYERVRAQT